MPVETDAALQEILGLGRIAVVGCSSAPGKDAHEVPKYLHERGYEVVPVNPHADEIFGREAADSLAAVDDEIDVVCVFRPGDELEGIVDDALERDDVRVVWTQRGIRNDEPVERVETEGLTVVQDRCLRVEHRRLIG